MPVKENVCFAAWHCALWVQNDKTKETLAWFSMLRRELAMLTAELSFTAQLRKSVTLSPPLSLFFYSAWHRNASRLWCWPQKQVIKRLEGVMNIHMGDLRGEETQKPDRGVSSQAPVSLNDSNTNPFRSLWAHGGEKHLHTNTNMPPHTRAHTKATESD